MREFTYLGYVEEKVSLDTLPREIQLPEESVDKLIRIEQRNKFGVGDVIEIMKPNGENINSKVVGIYTEKGESRESAPHPKEKLYIALDKEAEVYDILRVKKDE